MSNRDKVLDYARGEIGYSRWSDPEEGTKYGRWYANMSGEAWCAANGIPYCAMFVSWCCSGSVDWDVLPSYNCDQIRERARAAGYVLSNKYDARAGDIVLYDWNFNGSLDHVGIVEENCGDYLTTIEGNTSTGNAGSQGNGGVVARRTRSWKYVACVVRPPYDEDTSTSDQTESAPSYDSGDVDVDGWCGYATISKWQQALGTEVDGVMSGQYSGNRKYCLNLCSVTYDSGGYSTLVRATQRRIGAEVDGYFGRETITALQEYLECNGYSVGSWGCNGYFGHDTVCALQRSLNDNLW